MPAPRWDTTRANGLERHALVVGSLSLTVYQLAAGDPWYLDFRRGSDRFSRRAYCRDLCDAQRWALLQVLPLAELAATQAAADAQAIADLLRELPAPVASPAPGG